MASRYLASDDPFMPFIAEVRIGRRGLTWWENVEEWLETDEAQGYYYVNTSRMKQSEWKIQFTDENTAFAFKLRFA